MGTRILARRGGRASYSVRIARSLADVQAAQTLRFMVFNVELEEGLESSYLTCRDEDPFDAVCDHLLVECEGEVVGTYRMQSGKNAAGQLGYYSAQEFDLTSFEPLRPELIELGRACVHREHRNLTVLGLLWRGIAAYARERDCRYLVGCSSLTSQNPQEGAALFRILSLRHLAPPEIMTRPLPGWACPLELSEAPAPRIPKLLSAYLSLGAKICAPPAIDREFKTIDFLTLLDLQALPAGSAKLLA